MMVSTDLTPIEQNEFMNIHLARWDGMVCAQKFRAIIQKTSK